MASKSMKRVAPMATKPAPLSEEELKLKKAQFFMQKREAMVQGILYNLVQSCGEQLALDNKGHELRGIQHDIVDLAIGMADRLIFNLYGVNLERGGDEGDAEDNG